jgi:NAD(P)-dependent dehydrogenase (short-subunit alcohol dehydrogenase family)
MDLALRDSRVLVTGATGGLGVAISRALAGEGAQLILHGRSADKLAALAASLRAATTICTDLETPDGAQRLIDQAIGADGAPDVLIACAGATRGGAFAEIDDDAWRRNLELKLLATIRVVRAVLPAMRARRSGRIVIVVGNNGREPDPKALPGAVANAGLLAFVRGLAHEIAADGIAINAVNPGPVDSPRWHAGMAAEAARTGKAVVDVEAPYLARIPSGRLATPEDVARHVLFLASPVASHVTGSAVTVDGGASRGIG